MASMNKFPTRPAASSGGSGGLLVPASITNYCSGGTIVTGIQNSAIYANAKSYASGSTTANTLKTIVSVSGDGVLLFCSAFAADATSRTARLRLTVDDVVVFDATTSTLSALGQGLVAVGSGGGSSTVFCLDYVPFERNMKVEIASSLTESNGITSAVGYRT